jgi:hypothetical protein
MIMDSTPETPPERGGAGRDRRRPLVIGGLLLVVGLGLFACYMAWGRTAPNDESPRSFLIAVGFLFAKGIGIYLIFFGVGLLAFEAH